MGVKCLKSPGLSAPGMCTRQRLCLLVVWFLGDVGASSPSYIQGGLQICRDVGMVPDSFPLPKTRPSLPAIQTAGLTCARLLTEKKKPRNFGVSPGKNLPGSRFLAQPVAQLGAWPSLPFPALGMPQVSLTACVLISVGFSCSCMTWVPWGRAPTNGSSSPCPQLPVGCSLA